MSTPLAGPDRSQVATTERRIGRKPRKFRDKFESMLCPEKPFYNNDLWLAEGVGPSTGHPKSANGFNILLYFSRLIIMPMSFMVSFFLR